MSQETPMSITHRCNEGGGEDDLCAKPIPPEEIPPGNDTSVVSRCHEGASKVGLQSQPIRSGEVITQNEPEFIGEVFQDDIIRRFMDYRSFKYFALSGDGLKLGRYDVQTIEDDNRHQSVEIKKLEYLYKWKEAFKGTDADAIKKIKDIVTTYTQFCNEGGGEVGLCAMPIPPEEIPSGNGSVVVSVSNEGAGKDGLCAMPIPPEEILEPGRIEDVFQDVIFKRFPSFDSFKQFALAGNGLSLPYAEVKTIEENNVNKSKSELLYKWLELEENKEDAVEKIRRIATTHLKSRR